MGSRCTKLGGDSNRSAFFLEVTDSRRMWRSEEDSKDRINCAPFGSESEKGVAEGLKDVAMVMVGCWARQIHSSLGGHAMFSFTFLSPTLDV